jgi:hypothetical protein
MRPIADILVDAERGIRGEEGGYLAETMREIVPFLRSIASQDSSPAQVVLDVMFEILSRCHAGEYASSERDDVMSYARAQLIKMGINVIPMGMSHAVIVRK